MKQFPKHLNRYIQRLDRLYRTGSAREESYYPELKSFLESIDRDIEVIVAPKSAGFGFPDFKVIRKSTSAIVGYIEAKDVGEDLDRVENTEQIKRYLSNVPNFILTNFLEFRFYRDGKLKDSVEVAKLVPSISIVPIPNSKDDFQRLIGEFLQFSFPPIQTIDKLAKILAIKTRILKKAIRENISEPLVKSTLETIKENLFPEIGEELFSDIFAQTITYSLLIASLNRKSAGEKSPLTIDNVSRYIPTRLKIVRAILLMFSSGAQVEETPDAIRWAIEDIIDVINAFSGSIDHSQLITYFYEPFLKEYDPGLREIRGVYYTPKEVVSFINRAISHLLRETGRVGLSDESVKALDPCAGTAAFVSSAVDMAVREFIEIYGDAEVSSFVERHILENFYAFELLIAPYVIGHLSLETQLKNYGYDGEKSFKLYLTNTLSRPIYADKHHGHILEKVLQDEKAEADRVKEQEPIIVIMGNPPYSGISANMNEWIDELLKKNIDVGKETIQSYYEVDGKPLRERKLWLQDDYVKFIRFAQWKIAKTGKGIIGFITNHAYLDNPTFRGMRQSLLKTFDRIYIINLHGNIRKKEEDENIFDIQQGVAIGIFVKEKRNPEEYARVYYFSTLEAGLKSRQDKLKFLQEKSLLAIQWKEIKPVSPFYFFIPSNITEELKEEYERGWKITDIFEKGVTGIVTARDSLVIDFDKSALIEKIRMFIDPSYTTDMLKSTLKIRENYQWRISEARIQLRKALEEHSPEEFILPILYRPFDIRWIFYHPSVVWRTRKDLMIHMLRGENMGLVIPRQVKTSEWKHALATKWIMEFNLTGHAGSFGSGYLFPLYLYLPKQENSFLQRKEHIQFPIKPNPKDYERVPNFTSRFLDFIRENYGDSLKPEEIFYYIYAILYHPEYRSRYAEFLKYDFPRIPFPESVEEIEKFSKIGEELVKLHLMEFHLKKPPARFMGEGNRVIEKIRFDSKNRRLYINRNQYFEPILQEEWDYYIGGYRVLEKWLKERKGRIIDSQQFSKVIHAIRKTIEIQRKLEQLELPIV